MNRLLGTRSGLVVALGLICLGVASNQGVRAQGIPPNCACAISVQSGTAVIGTISSVQGEVLTQGQTGFRPARSGAALTFGGRLMTGPQGSAFVDAGPNCSLQLPPSTELNVLANGTDVCIQVTNLAPPPPAQPVEQSFPIDQGSGGINNRTLLIIGGLAAAGGGIAAGVVLTDDDDPPPPASP